jgi:hypothetical protein
MFLNVTFYHLPVNAATFVLYKLAYSICSKIPRGFFWGRKTAGVSRMPVLGRGEGGGGGWGSCKNGGKDFNDWQSRKEAAAQGRVPPSPHPLPPQPKGEHPTPPPTSIIIMIIILIIMLQSFSILSPPAICLVKLVILPLQPE